MLDGRDVSEFRVAPLAVVDDLDVLEHGVGQVDSSAPFLPVQKLDPHAGPEGLHHRILVAVADSAEGGHEPGFADLVCEGTRGELGSVVGVDDPAGSWFARLDGHIEGVDDEVRVLRGVDRPADDLP